MEAVPCLPDPAFVGSLRLRALETCHPYLLAILALRQAVPPSWEETELKCNIYANGNLHFKT